METLKPIQNPERYSHKETNWIVSSLPNNPTQTQLDGIKPITITKGSLLTSLKGVLSVDGIVVKVGVDYLCSKMTLDLIKESDNPHWDIIQNGVIRIKSRDIVIGKTIPIITINRDSLLGVGGKQDRIAQNSGVNSIDYIYEGDMVEGIPMGLIQQIDYTLLESITRPGDSFSHYDWEGMVNVDSVYNINPLNTSTTQTDGKLDKVKLNTFLTDIKSRLKLIHSDTELIKQAYYNGVLPTSLSIKRYTDKVASTESSNDNGTYNVTSKVSDTVTINDTPLVKGINSVSSSVDTLRGETQTNQTDLASQIKKQNDEFQRAQMGDLIAQQQLRDGLALANGVTTELSKKLSAGNK